MGTARWAGGRSLQERKEASWDTSCLPPGASFHPLCFLEITCLGCQPPGAGSPEVYHQLPQQGLPPPNPGTPVPGSPQGLGLSNPPGRESNWTQCRAMRMMKIDGSSNHRPNPFNCFAFVILI